MATYGYILQSALMDAGFMFNHLPSNHVFTDTKDNIASRPGRAQMFSLLKANDCIIVPNVAHIIGNTFQLAVLLDYCSIRNIRFLSIEDKIDTGSPQTALNIVGVFRSLDSNLISVSKIVNDKPIVNPCVAKPDAYRKCKKRDETAVNMYLAGLSIASIRQYCNIGKTSLYRILKRHGIAVDRRP